MLFLIPPAIIQQISPPIKQQTAWVKIAETSTGTLFILLDPKYTQFKARGMWIAVWKIVNRDNSYGLIRCGVNIPNNTWSVISGAKYNSNGQLVGQIEDSLTRQWNEIEPDSVMWAVSKTLALIEQEAIKRLEAKRAKENTI